MYVCSGHALSIENNGLSIFVPVATPIRQLHCVTTQLLPAR